MKVTKDKSPDCDILSLALTYANDIVWSLCLIKMSFSYNGSFEIVYLFTNSLKY